MCATVFVKHFQENGMAKSSPIRRLSEVIAAVEETAPPRLAVDGDPIGLHHGSLSQPIRKVAVALDAGLAAQDMAAKMKADLLLVHHPRFWGGLKTLRQDSTTGRRAAKMARLGLAVYSAHTNLDIAPGGVNDVLADTVGLACRAPIVPVREEKLCKLVAFVPASHVEQVRKAICAAGAGAIGNYADCTFRARGTGTFSCGENTRPFQGTPGSFEEADEYRLETIFGEYARDAILAALLRSHPYEEVAFDIYPLLNKGTVYGIGRVGELPRPEPVAKLAARLAKASGSTMTQYAAASKRAPQRIAVWSGAGVEVAPIAASGAEAVVAGEISYHDVESFLDEGVSVVTLGHGFSEEPALKPWAARLGKMLPGVAFTVLPKGLISMTNVMAK